MNKRQKKKKDKDAIKLARKINFSIDDNMTYWKYNSKIKRADMKYRYWKGSKAINMPIEHLQHRYRSYVDAKYNFKYELESKEMLLKVCRKCLQDGFFLEEYFLWEIPYKNENGWIMCFVNIEDFINCHQLNKTDTKIREIDFWCPYNSKVAIPQGLDNNSNQYDCATCFDAVYDD